MIQLPCQGVDKRSKIPDQFNQVLRKKALERCFKTVNTEDCSKKPMASVQIFHKTNG